MRKIKLKPIKQLKYPKGTRIIFMTDAAQFYAYKVGEHERQTLEDFRRRFQSLLNDEWRNCYEED